jgi:hypothetical protein
MQHRGLVSRPLHDTLVGVGFLALVVWVIALVSEGKLSAAGDAVAVVTGGVALFTAAYAVRGVEIQWRAISDDHALQRNSRLRELYAEYLAVALRIAEDLGEDAEIQVHLIQDLEQARQRTIVDYKDLSVLAWRIRLFEFDHARKQDLRDLESGLRSAVAEVHDGISTHQSNGKNVSGRWVHLGDDAAVRSKLRPVVERQLQSVMAFGDRLSEALEQEYSANTRIADPSVRVS